MQTMQRRGLLCAAALGCLAGRTWAQASATPQVDRLGVDQSRAFRHWFCAIVQDQANRAPTPRWVHRDCAGLVRFAVREALQAHDARWLRAMGWPLDVPRPPELGLDASQRSLGRAWLQPDGSRDAFASALALVQGNTRALGRDGQLMQGGDLLFFDQGAEQHLMVWTGRAVTYHTGSAPTAEDNGLRSTSLAALRRHPDTRWRPESGNPNFAGWYRFSFLA
jgi:uncharacterized protein YfaT (DUF1175 family)